MDKQLETLVSLNPIEPIEIAEAVLMVKNGQVLYMSPTPSHPNAEEEWQRLFMGMRRAQYAQMFESVEARNDADPQGYAEGAPEKPGT